MPARTYICLIDLREYDQHVAPALRLYATKYDPSQVVALLREVISLIPQLKAQKGRVLLGLEDYEHWVDSLAPDAGHQPSAQTLREISDMLVGQLCLPRDPALNPTQELDPLVPWLSDRSEWFADLMDGGEELAGGSLEFTFGTGRLTATRQQIKQFHDEVVRAGPPAGELAADYLNLRHLLELAGANTSYTLLKTTLS